MYKPRFKGTHYGAAFHYGQLLRKAGVKLAQVLNFSKEQESVGKASLEICSAVYPEIIQEINGMADGLSIDQTKLGIFIITAGGFSTDFGCTVFCFAVNGQTWFIRNHDMFTSLKKTAESAVYRLDGCNTFLSQGDALIGKEDGINEHGLAAGVNFIAQKKIQAGLNFLLLVRLLLEKCRTVEEGINTLLGIPSLTSHIITLADKSGAMAAVEMSPGHIEVRRPAAGTHFLVSTNHFMHENMIPEDNRPENNWYYTLDRYKTVFDGFARGTITGRDMGLDIASGKYGFVCQYDKKLGFDTLWSVCYGLHDLSVLRAEGNPQKSRFCTDTRLEWAIKQNRKS